MKKIGMSVLLSCGLLLLFVASAFGAPPSQGSAPDQGPTFQVQFDENLMRLAAPAELVPGGEITIAMRTWDKTAPQASFTLTLDLDCNRGVCGKELALTNVSDLWFYSALGVLKPTIVPKGDTPQVHGVNADGRIWHAFDVQWPDAPIVVSTEVTESLEIDVKVSTFPSGVELYVDSVDGLQVTHGEQMLSCLAAGFICVKTQLLDLYAPVGAEGVGSLALTVKASGHPSLARSAAFQVEIVPPIVVPVDPDPDPVDPDPDPVDPDPDPVDPGPDPVDPGPDPVDPDPDPVDPDPDPVDPDPDPVDPDPDPVDPDPSRAELFLPALRRDGG
jgi:hypothetical protein